MTIKNIKQLFSVILFCTLLVCCGKFFRYILVDDTSSYTRITFHEMYGQDNIDVLFVGSSHCYRSFIPEILDEELKMNTFNAGTSSQDLDGSFMIIKEAARYNDIRQIYLELYYDKAFAVYKKRTQMTQTYIISDYLKMSWDKICYLLQASAEEHYPNSFITGRRNWSDLFQVSDIKKLIQKKLSDDYKNYAYTYVTKDNEWYDGKGYVANNKVVENWNYFSKNNWKTRDFNHVSDDWLHTLEDIIAFCDANEIALTLVSAPVSAFQLSAQGNYDDYIELVKEITAETDVAYYDFNLCRETYFPNTSSLFMDPDHLNCYGAETFSCLFADLVNGRIAEEALFYDSYKEKCANMEPAVLGISYQDSTDEEGQKIRECKIISTGEVHLEYRLTLIPDGESPSLIRDFASDCFFTMDPDSHGKCVIEYRLENRLEEVQAITVSY